jgi:histidyl-tRNA synthetase
MKETAKLTDVEAAEVVRLASVTGTNDEILRQIEPLAAGSALAQEGAARLADVLSGARAAGVPETRIHLKLYIARGLDYYTGTIFETYLDQLPQIGSVCSGGRYDNLAGLFTQQELPGIGGSLGLDRLLAAMEELGMLEKVATPAPVFIPYFDPKRLSDYLRLAAAIRAAGIGAEVYPDPKKLGQQLKYADRRGFRVAIVDGSREFEAGSCQVKDLANGSQCSVPLEPDGRSVVAAVGEILARGDAETRRRGEGETRRCGETEIRRPDD